MLAASPALRLELVGSAGPDDVRALQEAAVLADLQADQGVLARPAQPAEPRHAQRGPRCAGRASRGRPGDLDADDAAQLEEWVAAKTVTDDDLRALASGAAAAPAIRPVEDYGVAAGRVVLRDPAPDTAAGTRWSG